MNADSETPATAHAARFHLKESPGVNGMIDTLERTNNAAASSAQASPKSVADSVPVASWLKAHRECCDMRVREIALAESGEWILSEGRISHRSRGFFSVVGATLSADGRRELSFDQPLILQPEIGILGFIIKHERGEPWVLVQAKPEPGNVLMVQAAPSVQATESNYLRRHGGAATPFLEIFREARPSAVLSDSLQSEQGTRFLGKYNRNMVVQVAPDECRAAGPALRWFPLRELLPLLATDYQINTDARSVLACAPWQALAPHGEAFAPSRGDAAWQELLRRSYATRLQATGQSTKALLARLQAARDAAHWQMQIIDIHQLHGWQVDRHGIRTDAARAFAVRHFHVETTQREVRTWDQPLIEMTTEGDVVLLAQERAGLLRFAFRASSEIGFRERCQFGPTLQDLGDPCFDQMGTASGDTELRRVCAEAPVVVQCHHSDEGGRFHRCISRYSIRMAPRDKAVEDDSLVWMSLGDIAQMIVIPGTFSNEARSAISMLLATV